MNDTLYQIQNYSNFLTGFILQVLKIKIVRRICICNYKEIS
jgi:hypothetical protein